MAPEAPNYIQKAELVRTETEEVDIMKDPSKFDEAALRKMYKDKLDKASGNKILQGPAMTKYLEAMKQIDANIRMLKELRDYAVSRLRIMDMANVARDYPVIDGPVKYVIFSQYYAEIQQMLKNPPKAFHAMLQFNIKDQKEFQKVSATISGMLDKYYQQALKNGGQKEWDKVKSVQATGQLRLVHYLDLENQMGIIQDFIDEGMPGAKNAPAMMKAAKERVAAMAKTLKEAIPMLEKDDKFAVENFAEATKATHRKEKNSNQWWNGALQYMAMRYSHQDAERKQTEALAYGSDTGTYSAANKLYEQAMQKEKGKNYKAADDLFMAARDKFRESRDIYVAQQDAKKKGKKKVV